MKSFRHVALLAGLLLIPAVAFAAPAGNWTGPHIGVLLGANSASSDATSTETAFTASFMAGYDFQLANHFVLGVDGFYEWNNDKTHDINQCTDSCTIRYGSRVYGVSGRAGFPVGSMNQFMPYVRVGYGWSRLSGDLSHDDSSPRYGVGLEWMSDAGTVSLVVQYMHQKLDTAGSADIKNNNFTIGANFFF